MKKFYILFAAFLTLGVSTIAFAGQAEFCAGFTEGYKSIKGDLVSVPSCPLAPVTPFGSTDYREGIKAGIKAADEPA